LALRPIKNDSVKGGLFAFAAFFLWGILPLYWKLFAEVSTFEVLCHRVLWSSTLLTFLLFLRGGFPSLWRYLKNSKHAAWVLFSTVFIASNWFLFIYSVQANRLIEGSLGYYMNPLLFVVLGRVFLGERLSRLQAAAFGVALLGVANQTLHFGKVPWLGISLALTFGMYGLVRKKISLDSISILWVETTLVSFPAAVWVIHAHLVHRGAFLRQGPRMTFLLLAAGVITAIPLLCFGRATQLLRLSTVGFFQFLGPTLQLLIAVFIFGEPFTQTHVLTFTLIWIAVGIYCYEGFRRVSVFS